MLFGLFGRKGKTIDQIAEEIEGFGARNAAGQVVTTRTALEVATVLACVDVIASGISVPEMQVMRDLGGGTTEKATDVAAYRMLHRRPNEWQTSTEFRHTLTMHAALTGNAYAMPVRDMRTNEITEIWPLMPHMVTIDHTARYDLVYRVTDEFGPIGVYRPDQILHIRNNSWDRIKGMNAVNYAAKAIGLSMASEENIASLHENGGRPSGLLTTEESLTPEAISRIKAGWKSVTQGRGRSGTALLDQGVKYHAMAMSAVDAQALETRRMQVEEICRAMGVFPIMVGHSDKTATFASAEAFFAAHNRKTVKRWQRIWAERLDEFVLDGAGPLFVQFENEEIRTASLKDQADFFAKALGTGGGVPFMTVNEVRAARGLSPVENGDEIREPAASTMAPQGDDDGTAPDPIG